MKIQLDFGYMDHEDVVEECEQLVQRTDCSYIVQEGTSTVKVLVYSPYRSELVKFTKKFLGLGTPFDNSVMAEAVVDLNVVQ